MNMSTARLARVAAPAAVVAGAAALVLGGLPAQAGTSALTHRAHHDPAAVFTYTGAQQTWLVPAGVTSVTVTAIGAAGQSTNGGINTGGLAASVFSTFGVLPGQTLYVEVGGAGSGAVGGFNGGGNGGVTGGGGGGASDVRTISRANPGTLTSRLVVAGGGGGAGTDGSCLAGGGGNGGSQAAAGDTGGDCTVALSGGGGGGAGASPGGTAGGAGAGAGSSAGTAGSLGQGGAGGNGNGAGSDGGGGGGGVFGGGGGGGGGDDGGGNIGAGGGGGGGDSMGISFGSTASAASVTISYSTTSALSITTSSPLPSGTKNHSYSTSLTASGGTPGYTWSLASGGLPAGLTLSSGGVISGTPTANGTKTFTVRVTDAASATATKTFSLTIGGTAADLAVLLSHEGTFRHDRNGKYQIEVANTNSSNTSLETHVSLLLPSGVKVVQGGKGTYWQCHKQKHSSFCARNAKIDAHSSTTITVKVKITAAVGKRLKAKAIVSPTDSTPGDNTSFDFATVHRH